MAFLFYKLAPYFALEQTWIWKELSPLKIFLSGEKITQLPFKVSKDLNSKDLLLNVSYMLLNWSDPFNNAHNFILGLLKGLLNTVINLKTI